MTNCLGYGTGDELRNMEGNGITSSGVFLTLGG